MRKNPSLNTVIKSLLNSIEELEYLELKLKGIYDDPGSNDSSFGGPLEERKVETKPAETKPAETKPAETNPAETKPAAPAPNQQSEAGQRALDAMARNAREAITAAGTGAGAGAGAGAGKDNGSFNIDLEIPPVNGTDEDESEKEFNALYRDFSLSPEERRKKINEFAKKNKDNVSLQNWKQQFQEQQDKLDYIRQIGGDPSNGAYQRILTGDYSGGTYERQGPNPLTQGATAAREAIQESNPRGWNMFQRFFARGPEKQLRNIEYQERKDNQQLARLQANLENAKTPEQVRRAAKAYKTFRDKAESTANNRAQGILSNFDRREDQTLTRDMELYKELQQEYADDPEMLDVVMSRLKAQRESDPKARQQAEQRKRAEAIARRSAKRKATATPAARNSLFDEDDDIQF